VQIVSTGKEACITHKEKDANVMQLEVIWMKLVVVIYRLENNEKS
jgi:hypothetical protein